MAWPPTTHQDVQDEVTTLRTRTGELATEHLTTTPPTPTTGLTLFARARGRRLLSFIGPSGQDTALQPAMFSNRIARWNAVNNAAAPTLDGLAVSNVATPTAVNNAATNYYTSMVRARFSTTTTAGNGAGTRSSSTQWFLSATPNLGGFFFVVRFGLNAAPAGNRLFLGMNATNAALAGGTQPSAFVNCIGFGADSGDTGWSVIHNDASGTATKIALGTAFRATVAATDFYEFRLFAPSGNATLVRWSAHRLNDGAVEIGDLTTNLPPAGTMLAAHVHHSNGTAAATAAIDLQSLYIETDN